MGKKRKRPVKGKHAQGHSSQIRITAASTGFRNQSGFSSDHATKLTHPVISLYYQEVVTLRQFLLRQIPSASRSRRRKIASVRTDFEEGANDSCSDSQRELAILLDSTLVGITQDPSPVRDQERSQELAALRKSQPKSQLASTDTGPPCAQAELVDRAIALIWKPFLSESKKRPHHLLTRGFRSAVETHFSNETVQKLKSAPWTEVLGLLGNNGEVIMLYLLCDCGIFTALDSRKGIYHQICGYSLEKLDPINTKPQQISLESNCSTTGKGSVAVKDGQQMTANCCSKSQSNWRTPSAIVFNRHRMLYASPMPVTKGKSKLGLGNHVLNRYTSSVSQSKAVHVMQHIFPLQFALTNVFKPDPENDLKFSSREDEIAAKSRKRKRSSTDSEHQFMNNERVKPVKIPKRLQGQALELVRQLLNRHKSCPYGHLLDYYCSSERIGPWKLGPRDSQSSAELNPPASEKLTTQERELERYALNGDVSTSEGQKEHDHIERPAFVAGEPAIKSATVLKPSLTDYATPTSSISAYCQAAIRKLIPPQFFGAGQNRIRNQSVIFKNVDRFVRMRRYENMSLQEVCKGVKISCISWLGPAAGHDQLVDPSHHKLSLTDLQKRTELFHEFMYYLFESILIPMIRAAFYVTESQCHRNRLFYFRHDVWRTLTEQPIDELQASMFEELKPEEAQRVLGQRTLGYGSLRLLPKATGIRPIVNLKRRMPSSKRTVNSTVGPILSVLNYEKMHNPAHLGSCLNSVGELHSRLKRFKRDLLARQPVAVGSLSLPRLYFVKVDIQSCFDTIPQQSMVRLVDKVVSADAYHFTKYVEMKPADEFNNMWPLHGQRQSRAWKRWVGRAAPTKSPLNLEELASRGGTSRRRNTVFVDTFWQWEKHSDDLLDLLEEHVRNNMVKFGERFFRQRNGIPQGSVLSSLLCNLFYAEMEREALEFLRSDNTLLLRLIDDFLLITSDVAQAKRFLQVMIRGQPAYGISVNPAKSLVNFSVQVDGAHIPRIVDARLFPYCGSLIDSRTLELHKDHDRILDGGESVAASLANSLTVESTRTPARSLHRKLLTSFKALMHPMYLDTQHNSVEVALANLYASFVISGMRLYRYTRSLSGRAHPAPEVVVRIIRDLVYLANRLILSRRQEKANSSAAICSAQPAEVEYLAAAAFQAVLGRKQTRYVGVLRWLQAILRETRPKSTATAARLALVVRRGNAVYDKWKF